MDSIRKFLGSRLRLSTGICSSDFKFPFLVCFLSFAFGQEKGSEWTVLDRFSNYANKDFLLIRLRVVFRCQVFSLWDFTSVFVIVRRVL